MKLLMYVLLDFMAETQIRECHIAFILTSETILFWFLEKSFKIENSN